MMMPRTRRTGIVLAFVTAAISGVSVFVNGYGTKRFDDATVYTTSKNLVAAVLLGALAFGAARFRSSSAERVPFTARERWGFLAVGLVGGAIPFVLFFEGLKRAGSTDAAFLQKTLVVWVALLAVPLLRERLNAGHIAAIALLIVGQAKLASGWPTLRADAASTLILGATLCWAVEVVIAKQLLPRRSALTLGASRMGIGVVALIAWVAITGRFHDLVGLSANEWGWALLTGVLLCAYVASWFAALARAQAVDVTAVLVGGALLTAALNAAAGGLALRPQASGLLVITIGVALACVATRYSGPSIAATSPS
jgi:drug/metabolite transporter (DMT)-like permease